MPNIASKAHDENMKSEIYLIRHGETAWSLSGQHTGRTDIALTEAGKLQAAGIAARLGQKQFLLVLTSPLQRAAETCRLAGFGLWLKWSRT